MSEIQTLILIRFSYLAQSGFRRVHVDDNAYKDYLFDEKRLYERLAFFQTLTIPSLQSQSDQNFRILILLSENFPEWAEIQLAQALTIAQLDFSFIKRPSLSQSQACQEAFQQEFDPKIPYHLSIRLDDDDAIAKDWIKNLHETSQSILPLLENYSEIALFPAYGLMIDLAGLMAPINAVYAKRPQSVGTGLLTKNSTKNSIYNYPHQELPQSILCLSLPQNHQFLRLMHHDNGSRAPNVKSNEQVKILDTDPYALLEIVEENFGINLPRLDQLMNIA